MISHILKSSLEHGLVLRVRLVKVRGFLREILGAVSSLGAALAWFVHPRRVRVCQRVSPDLAVRRRICWHG